MKSLINRFLIGLLAVRLGVSTAAVADDNVQLVVGSIMHDIPKNLFGVFFEEINHAGEGGLYAELVNDRSFEGLAFENGFLDSEATQTELPFPLPPREAGVNPVSWHAQPGTILKLTKELPLNQGNPIALNLTTVEGDAAVFNEGYWGISVGEGKRYHLVIYLQGNSFGVSVSLESSEGAATYAVASFTNVTDSWSQYTALFTSNATDNAARLAIRIQGRGPIFVDFVSLFPEENGPAGSTSPFRQDLLQLLKDLHPKAIRLPGGCYVEGQKLASGYFWQPSIGAPETRPGHWNGPWRYWSTDGLGLFEYMELAEELGADAVWVFNNGVAHDESIPTADIQPLIRDTLGSLEFVRGSPESKWGSVRAQLGRQQPWPLNYVAIGNEDCGKPFYTNNYIAFYEAIHALYPDIQLIANCDMRRSAPADLWDWHWYASAPDMFAGRTVFDGSSRADNGSIYASEYAVFDWGIQTSPVGNLQGAVAEAGFMTGIERNSHVVEMAAFAPLFVHINHTVTCPSNLIGFDGSRSFGTPSYHVQALFAKYQGKKYLQTDVRGAAAANSVAASAVCLDVHCQAVSLKMINFQDKEQPLNITLTERGDAVSFSGSQIALRAGSRLDSNSLADPNKVAPTTTSVSFSGPTLSLQLPAWSLYVLNLNITKPESITYS